MRLLVVTQVFWPENFRVNDLVAEMVARGHQVTVLTGVPNYPGGRRFPEYSRNPGSFSRFEGAQILRVPILTRGQSKWRLVLNYISFAVSASVVGGWKLRKQAFDVIFVYEPSPVTVGIPGVLLRRTKNAPLAFWVLDLWPETLQALGIVRSGILLRAVEVLVRFLYRRSDLILAQSRSFIPQIARYSPDRERIRYFPSWAENVFTASAVAPAPEIDVCSGMFNVMFAGNIGEAQDFPAILDAVELLKAHTNIRWLVVGEGRKSDWVREEIFRRGIGKSIRMLGRYPVERMPSFYAHADVLLLSLADRKIFSMTIPGKLQSYLAAGIPIVAMLNGEGAEVVERFGAGVTCKAGDAPGLAAAVLHLASLSRSSLREMGRNARVACESEFDRDSLLSGLERWLEELINDGRRPVN